MNRTLFVGLTTGVLLAGCGGGGDGGNGGVINPPDELMQISAANAAVVAGSSYEAARASGDVSDLTGETGLLAADPGQSAIVKNNLATANETGSGGATAQVPIPATTEPCEVDGEVTFSGEIADPFTPTLTSGDFIEVTFDMCIDVPGETTDGFLRMDIDAFSGDFAQAAFDLTATLTAEALTVTTPEETASIDGDTTVRIDTEQTPYVEASVSGDRMTLGDGTNTHTLFDFVATETFDGNFAPAPYTYSAAGTLESTRLPGPVRYSTPVTFEGFAADYPSSGEFLVEGQDSAVKLVALNNIQVLIQVDADGDGVFEQETESTWAEITSQ